jgi:putative hydrolase of the HAD superfamily
VAGAADRVDRDQGRAAEPPLTAAAAEPAVVLFDIGGVLLTNGWDHVSRARAAEAFALDDGFEARHTADALDLDTARISLDTYLDRVVFDRERPFTREAFVAFMQSESKPFPDTIAVLDEIVATGRYLVLALNNESRELNDYRIDRFELARRFDGFLSSCYLGLAKPDPAIYMRMLQIVHRAPESCVFVDDRTGNIESAVELGIHGVHHTAAASTRETLRALGVRI